jgi:ribosomal protein S4E
MGGGTAVYVQTQDHLNTLKTRYDLERFIVGHCIRTNIDRHALTEIIRVNVDNYSYATNGRVSTSRAIVIEGKKVTVLYGNPASNVVWNY